MDFFDIKNLNKLNKDENKIKGFTDGKLNLQVFSSSDPTTSYESLLHVKYLFQRMLPKMPKDYILRQVFDENQCIMTLNEQIEGKPTVFRIIGAILYRPCFSRKLMEIVFLAIDSDYHISGYGSFLFNCFKEVAKLQHLAYVKIGEEYKNKNIIITDLSVFDNPNIVNLADLEINKTVIQDHNDDHKRFKTNENYDIESMNCKQNSEISCDISTEDNTKSISNMNEIVNSNDLACTLNLMTYADNSAIGFFKKQGFSLHPSSKEWIGYIKDYEGGTLVECKIYKKINYLHKKEIIEKTRNLIFDKMKNINDFHILYNHSDLINSTNMLEDLKHSSGFKKRNKNEFLIDFLQFLSSSLQTHPSAWPFHEPVSSKDVPDYLDVIKYPMDLSTINEKIKSLTYTSVENFIRDVALMCNNCFTYNSPETQYYKCAENIKDYLADLIKIYKSTILNWGYQIE